MTSEMIMMSDGEITFMYRVGGIAIYDGRLLVEHNLRHRFCFVPGGRVEYGENATDALGREVREELGEEVQIGRLVLVTDHLFELGGDRFQEVALYFLIEFAPGSKAPSREGVFEGKEPGTIFQWIRLGDVHYAELFPTFLRDRVRDLPQSPEYVVHAEFDPSLTVRE